MISKKINLIIWSVLVIVFMMLTIMHPRICYGFMLFLSIIQWGEIAGRKKKIGKKSVWRKTILGITSLVIVWSMGDMINIFYPYHATYEYKHDILKLKFESSQKYQHFPGAIPKIARNVKWKCVPSLLQGSGYEGLLFYAEKEYIEEIYNKYASATTLYKYDGYEWRNEKLKKATFFPQINSIAELEREDVVVIILYENNDIHHPGNSGLYLNQTEGYVCFFSW